MKSVVFFEYGIFAYMYNKRIELTEEDYYLNEQGFKVFTEKFHLKRGYCCQSGCKHCPYGYDKKTNTFR